MFKPISVSHKRCPKQRGSSGASQRAPRRDEGSREGLTGTDLAGTRPGARKGKGKVRPGGRPLSVVLGPWSGQRTTDNGQRTGAGDSRKFASFAPIRVGLVFDTNEANETNETNESGRVKSGSPRLVNSTAFQVPHSTRSGSTGSTSGTAARNASNSSLRPSAASARR